MGPRFTLCQGLFPCKLMFTRFYQKDKSLFLLLSSKHTIEHLDSTWLPKYLEK